MRIADQAERLAKAVYALEQHGAEVVEARVCRHALPLVVLVDRPPVETIGGDVLFTGALRESMRTGTCTSLFGVSLTWEEPRPIFAIEGTRA